MQTSTQTNNALIREEIASAAYNLWERAGHPSARDMDFWFQAERQLTQSGNTIAADSKAAARQQKAPAATKSVSTSRAQSF